MTKWDTEEEYLKQLVSAEDFLEFFAVEYDEKVVQVKRLHIMQRYHDYLQREGEFADKPWSERFVHLRLLLDRAYKDFVVSDALTEKVFRVFQDHKRQKVFVNMKDIG